MEASHGNLGTLPYSMGSLASTTVSFCATASLPATGQGPPSSEGSEPHIALNGSLFRLQRVPLPLRLCTDQRCPSVSRLWPLCLHRDRSSTSWFVSLCHCAHGVQAQGDTSTALATANVYATMWLLQAPSHSLPTLYFQVTVP